LLGVRPVDGGFITLWFGLLAGAHLRCAWKKVTMGRRASWADVEIDGAKIAAQATGTAKS
jgi:hypothetical protein